LTDKEKLKLLASSHFYTELSMIIMFLKKIECYYCKFMDFLSIADSKIDYAA